MCVDETGFKSKDGAWKSGSGNGCNSALVPRRPPAFFVSAYGNAARDDNSALQRLLGDRGVSFRNTLPERLTPRSVSFIDSTDEIKHNDFVTGCVGAGPTEGPAAARFGLCAIGRSNSKFTAEELTPS